MARYALTSGFPLTLDCIVCKVSSAECCCKMCGNIFSPKRRKYSTFCSRDCAFEYRRIPPEVRQKREDEKIRNRLWERMKPLPFRDCDVCKTDFRPTKPSQRICCDECEKKQGRDRAREYSIAKHYASIKPRSCKQCERSFTPEYGDKHRQLCSDRCANRFYRAGCKVRKRLRITGAQYEPVNVMRLFERDQWRCQICGCKTPKRLRGTHHDRAPEADHRIPISKGGDHTYANIQCACRKCNGLKSNVTVIGQLPLFIN